MNFDVDKLVDTMEKRLGSFAANAFFAFVLFVIVAWGFEFVFSNIFVPVLSGLEGMTSWSIKHIFIVLFLFLSIGGLLYVLIRARSLSSKKLAEIRKISSTQKIWMEKFKERQGLFDSLKKMEEEYKNINENLSDLLDKMKKDADKLAKAQEEFEKEKTTNKQIPRPSS